MRSWTAVMALKNKETRTNGVANTLRRDEITTIMATMEFFGADDYLLRQSYFDLSRPRFRVFDWLAMMINGRRRATEDHQSNDLPIKVIAHAYIKTKGDIDDFIADLRTTDYDIDRSYESIELDKAVF